MTRKILLGIVKFVMVVAILAFLLTPRLLSLLGFSLWIISEAVAYSCLRILTYSDEKEIRFGQKDQAHIFSLTGIHPTVMW